MKAQDRPPHTQRRTLTATVLISFLALCVVGIASRAQDKTSSNREEREFKSTIPEHVPIKVKVKNEQSFKKMDNEKWLRELEIEIKNTGSKPIYFLYMVVGLPEVIIQGHPLAFQVRYGRLELVRLDATIQPEDVPIRPGESITLKVSKEQFKGYEGLREREKRNDAKKVEFRMQLINFGDGTGFQGHRGTPESVPVRKQTSTVPKMEERRSASPPNCRVGAAGLSVKFIKAFYSPEPARSLRVDFSPLFASISVIAPTLPCDCQNDNDCMWGEFGTTSCPCDEQFLAFLPAGGCANTLGKCRRTVVSSRTCDTEFNGQQICTFVEETGISCNNGEPKPTPTPTPTPTPQQECTGSPPNNTNCYCEKNYPDAPPFWRCLGCETSFQADHTNPQLSNGCPPDTYNDNDCCVALQTCAFVCGSQEAYELARQNCLETQGADPWRPYPDCDCGPPSPVLVDVAGDGLRLSNPAQGVIFDIRADGRPRRFSWTLPASDDAWLALDRNGNAVIDDGRELFGDFTEQPAPPAGSERNGFLALAEYDRTQRGGDANRVIDSRDAIYTALRLWRDVNHDGVSQASELQTLTEAGVSAIALDYKLSQRRDEYGNQFRYRAKVMDVRGSQVGRWAWDVFLTAARSQ